MSELEAALNRLRSHEGVDDVILLGRDGLVIRHIGAGRNDEPIAARVPGLVTACTALGGAAGVGSISTAVLEFESGVAVISVLSPEAFLAVLLRPGVGFAQLLRALRRERRVIAQLL